MAAKYKVGDTVLLKTYNEARGGLEPDANGNVKFGGISFNVDMLNYSNTVVTIAEVIEELIDPSHSPWLYPIYTIQEDDGEWLWPERTIKRKVNT